MLYFQMLINTVGAVLASFNVILYRKPIISWIDRQNLPLKRAPKHWASSAEKLFYTTWRVFGSSTRPCYPLEIIRPYLGSKLQKTGNFGQKIEKKSTKPTIKIVSMTFRNYFLSHLSQFSKLYRIIKSRKYWVTGKNR